MKHDWEPYTTKDGKPSFRCKVCRKRATARSVRLECGTTFTRPEVTLPRLIPDSSATKPCTKCGKVKSIEKGFGFSSREPDYHLTICKMCESKRRYPNAYKSDNEAQLDRSNQEQRNQGV